MRKPSMKPVHLVNAAVCIVVVVVAVLSVVLYLGVNRRITADGERFVTCIPLLIENGDLVYHPELLTETNKARWLRTHPHSMMLTADGTLLVKKKLADDRDLLANEISKSLEMSEREVEEYYPLRTKHKKP